MSHCVPLSYAGVPFVPDERPLLIAALLSANADGVIEPADGTRWFMRDAAEAQARRWMVPHQLRLDKLWRYRLTEDGREQAQALRKAGWRLDHEGAAQQRRPLDPEQQAHIRSVFGMPGVAA